MTKYLYNAAIALIFGFIGAAIWSYSGLAHEHTRAYLLENPQILPEMAEAFQAQEMQERLAAVEDDVTEAFPGAVLGNPQGSRVLVSFTDYNCPYCRAAQADVAKLVAEDPELKVVMRELPLFEGSEEAARMALAAGKQGKYRQFHEKLFSLGRANAETVLEAAKAVGLDIEQAQTDAASQDISLELMRTQSLANEVGFRGTPGWITGGQVLEGAVGYEALKEAINKNES